jgi:hypothetical protein
LQEEGDWRSTAPASIIPPFAAGCEDFTVPAIDDDFPNPAPASASDAPAHPPAHRPAGRLPAAAAFLDLFGVALLMTLPSALMVMSGPQSRFLLSHQDHLVLLAAYPAAALAYGLIAGLDRLRQNIQFSMVLVACAIVMAIVVRFVIPRHPLGGQMFSAYFGLLVGLALARINISVFDGFRRLWTGAPPPALMVLIVAQAAVALVADAGAGVYVLTVAAQPGPFDAAGWTAYARQIHFLSYLLLISMAAGLALSIACSALSRRCAPTAEPRP